MTVPANFTDSTSRHGLPYLFAGQAQKEFTVNEALARIDILLHPSVDAQLGSPPADPASGSAYLVAEPSSDVFTGRAGEIAGWDGQQWTFVQPVHGMRIRDASSGAILRYDNGWLETVGPAEPVGGTVIDVEARDAIASLLAALRQTGVIS